MGNTKKLLFNFLLLIIIFLCTAGCNTTEPPDPPVPPEPIFKLELDDVSCTEAWINLTTIDLTLPAELTLKQYNQTGDSIIINLILNNPDTLLYIDSLSPNTSYRYQASSIQKQVSSNELSVTTMDTTSHDFTWQTWTFGGTAGSSTVYDVAIINENCIWAVGEIYVADSSVNGYTMYNAVYWDGNEWELKRITVEFRGFQITPPLEGAFAFSSTDIWFVGSLPIHGDGENWVMYDLRTTVDPNLSLSRAWGTNSENMYFVGRNGSIAHKQNSNWSKIESGTDIRIADIWGIEEGGDYNKYLAVEDIMLKLDNYNELTIINAETGRSMISIWGVSNRLIYTAGGDGVVLFKNSMWEKIKSPDVNTIYGIKGQDYNAIFGLSATRSVLYFNGYRWQFINTPQNNSNAGLSIKDNLVAIVGWQNESAQITILKRN